VTETATGVALRLEELSVERGGRTVVHEVSLDVPPGEVTTLLGPNGAGKSTLVLAVGGVLRPSGSETRTSRGRDPRRSGRRASRSSPKGAGCCPS